MKSRALILIILIQALFYPAAAKTGENELGRRYLKLGNTYRESGSMDLAEKYLLKGYSIVKKHSDFYWTAVAEEYLGYYYIDNNDKTKALKYLKSAKSIYNVYGKLKNGEGSNKAIESVISSIEGNSRNVPEAIEDNKETPETNSKNETEKSLKVKPKPGNRKPVTGREKEQPIETKKDIVTGDDLAQLLKQKPEETELTDEEQKLYDLITAYRKQKGLPSIPLSKSLSYVAKVHVIDLEYNFTPGGECNLHSWSEGGIWKPVCYTPDHKNAELMWSKPSELTNYKGNGYEISAGTSNYSIEASTALSLWQNSIGHNNVIINGEVWKNSVWKAIGIGIYKGYACVWFGNDEDNN